MDHYKPPRPDMQECPLDPGRTLIDDETHLCRFTHNCVNGFFCVDKDPIHRQRFRHPRQNPSNPWEGKSGWKTENFRSPSCAPEIKVASLQTGLPKLSCNPRGGNRPQGGTEHRTEIRDFVIEKEASTKDEVLLIVHNIDELWKDIDFYTFLRDLMGTRALYSAKVVPGPSEFMNAGKGLVSCYNYADAYILKELVHGRNRPGKGTEVMTVAYAVPVSRPKDDIQDRVKRLHIKDIQPALKRFHQMIIKCGPYWQDAEALVDRLRAEGLTPALNTYILLLLSYRDARPPQPRRAEAVIDRMRKEGIAIHTTACNAVVDAWCRSGNLKRAEAMVAQMEKSSQAASKMVTRDATIQLATPNEQTYLILAEGWQRLGVMEDIAGRQRGYKYDEAREANHRETSIGGVLGLSDPAPSILTSLARRRAGYSHMNTGYQQQQPNADFFNAFETQKWRTRV